MSTILKQYNKFIVSNEFTASIYITILYKSNCQNNTFDIVVPRYTQEGYEITVILPTKEGVYKILYEDEIEGVQELIVYNYQFLLTSIVKNIQNILCNCSCVDCDDCDKTEKEYLTTLSKLISYNIINDSNYSTALTLTNDCVKCNILDSNQCISLNEIILGNSTSTLLFKQLIAYYYLVYYYMDLYQNLSSQIVTEIYQYNSIIKCIKKLGIDENCIQNNIYNFLNSTGGQ